ncbi:hypothetical protein KW783_04205 [Candidatus Parcubacteria bacterium]|nr:hypothetical protein [Candidatus Parcubacteria bacterium]
MRNSSLIVTVIIIIVIVAVGIYVYNRGGTDQTANIIDSLGNTSTSTSTPENTVLSVVVPNQKPGKSVLVSSVSLKRAGYVVVRADNAGKAGTVIGNSAILQPGSHQNVVIGLPASTVNARSYWAVLFSDNGDHVFAEDRDATETDEFGGAVTQKFTVSTTATTTAPTTTATGE